MGHPGRKQLRALRVVASEPGRVRGPGVHGRLEAEGEARLEPNGDGSAGAGRIASGRVDRAETLATIERWYRRTGRVLDPHTAVGVKVAEDLRGAEPTVCLATAHPGKFPDTAPAGAAVEHPRLAGLDDLPARKVVVPNDRGGSRGISSRPCSDAGPGPSPGRGAVRGRAVGRGGRRDRPSARRPEAIHRRIHSYEQEETWTSD